MARLVSCSSCRRHVRVDEPSCRFCGAGVATSAAPNRLSVVLLGLCLAACSGAGQADGPTPAKASEAAEPQPATPEVEAPPEAPETPAADGATTAGDEVGTAGETTAGETTAGETTAGETTAGETTAGETTSTGEGDAEIDPPVVKPKPAVKKKYGAARPEMKPKYGAPRKPGPQDPFE